MLRGFDTLGLLFDSFGGDKNSALFHKIETYRKALLIAQVKEGVFWLFSHGNDLVYLCSTFLDDSQSLWQYLLG